MTAGAHQVEASNEQRGNHRPVRSCLPGHFIAEDAVTIASVVPINASVYSGVQLGTGGGRRGRNDTAVDARAAERAADNVITADASTDTSGDNCGACVDC